MQSSAERTKLLAITDSEIFSIDSHNCTTTNTPTHFDCCFAPEQRKPLALWLLADKHHRYQHVEHWPAALNLQSPQELALKLQSQIATRSIVASLPLREQ
jgi:hypothetical protein